jgi:hypothetical protein
MTSITQWFKNLRAGQDADAVANAEQAVREGTPGESVEQREVESQLADERVDKRFGPSMHDDLR